MSPVAKKAGNIILDLDETLINSVDVENANNVKFQLACQRFRHKTFHSYYIFERPYLQEFLDMLFLNFNVSVWTAATGDYAKFVVNNFVINGNPNRQLDFVFSRNDVTKSEQLYNGTHKKLQYIYDRFPEYNSSNTVIIDDHTDVYKTQKNNCYNIKPFTALNPDYDNELAKLPIILWKLVLQWTDQENSYENETQYEPYPKKLYPSHVTDEHMTVHEVHVSSKYSYY